jgi:hypothetical protein
MHRPHFDRASARSVGILFEKVVTGEDESRCGGGSGRGGLVD